MYANEFSSKEILNIDWQTTEPIKDKDLVWCWDSNDKYRRVVRFYDAENDCTFGCETGERNACAYVNYEKFTGEWSKAIEAQKTLKD